MSNNLAMSTVRLFEALLPATWSERRAALEAARRLDMHHDGDGMSVLFGAWHAWRCCGQVPTAGPLRDLIATLAHLLGGVAHELRRRPREARDRQGRNDG